MKLTKSRLKQIIKEELQKALTEAPPSTDVTPITSMPPGLAACKLSTNTTVKKQCIDACTDSDGKFKDSQLCKDRREKVWNHYKD